MILNSGDSARIKKGSFKDSMVEILKFYPKASSYYCKLTNGERIMKGMTTLDLIERGTGQSSCIVRTIKKGKRSYSYNHKSTIVIKPKTFNLLKKQGYCYIQVNNQKVKLHVAACKPTIYGLLKENARLRKELQELQQKGK
jgi:hypothetical protein